MRISKAFFRITFVGRPLGVYANRTKVILAQDTFRNQSQMLQGYAKCVWLPPDNSEPVQMSYCQYLPYQGTPNSGPRGPSCNLV